MSPTEVRLKLRSAGFNPLPLVGKAPVIEAWQKRLDVTDHEIEFWGRTHPAAENTGVLTRLTPTFDIDILDPDAAAAVERLVRERFEDKGDVLVRTGRPPKRAIPFRALAPFAKIKRLFGQPDTPEKDCEKLEMLCDGQQVVVDGVHPDTGKPYSWFYAPPGEIKHDDLPPITAEEAKALVDDAARLLIEKFGYRIKPTKPPNHIWKSKHYDFPCSPVGEQWRDDRDGRLYARVVTPDGTLHVVPADELSPAHAGGGEGQADWDVTPEVLMDHGKCAALAMRLVKSGMGDGAVVNFLRAQVSALAGVDEDRRKRRLKEIPDMVESAAAKIAEEQRPVGPPSTLEETLAVFDKWLALDSHTPVLAALGAVAANYLDGDPVWLGVVAPPSSAKTEIVNSLSRLPHVAASATLTIAGLLSGTPSKQRAKTAKGGLLREIGDFGVLALKDFGSILSMRQDAKTELLAALREIYDGAWTRHIGADGGKTLAWKGKLGLVFGVTPAIDAYHSVIGSLGDRWLLSRMGPVKGQFARALEHRGASTKTMREELAEAVARLFAGRKQEASEISTTEIEQIDRKIALAVRLRGAVERDRRTRELDAVYGAEGTGRIGLALERLLAGLDALGAPRASALDVVESVALDSVPPQRRQAYEIVNARTLVTEITTTPQLAAEMGLPTVTVRRILEDLAAYGLIAREGKGLGKADEWIKADWEQEP
jgi:hypothetical protein